MGMMNAPGTAYNVRKDSCNQARDEGIIAHYANGQYFQCKYSTCKRRTEYCPKAGGDTRHQQYSKVCRLEPHPFAQQTGHTSADLYCGAFPAGRSTEKVSNDSCN